MSLCVHLNSRGNFDHSSPSDEGVQLCFSGPCTACLFEKRTRAICEQECFALDLIAQSLARSRCLDAQDPSLSFCAMASPKANMIDLRSEFYICTHLSTIIPAALAQQKMCMFGDRGSSAKSGPRLLRITTEDALGIQAGRSRSATPKVGTL